MKNSEDGICIEKHWWGSCKKYSITSGVRMNGVRCKDIATMDLSGDYAANIGVDKDNVRASCAELNENTRRRRLLKRSRDATSIQIEYNILARDDDDVNMKIWKLSNVDDAREEFSMGIKTELVEHNPSIKNRLQEIEVDPVEGKDLVFQLPPYIKRTPSSELRHTIFTMQNVLKQFFLDNDQIILNNRNLKINFLTYAKSLDQLLTTLESNFISNIMDNDAWEQEHHVCPIPLQWQKISTKMVNDFKELQLCLSNTKTCKNLNLQPYASIMDDIARKEKNNDSPLVNLIKTSEREMILLNQQDTFEKTTTKAIMEERASPEKKLADTSSSDSNLAPVMKLKSKKGSALSKVLATKNNNDIKTSSSNSNLAPVMKLKSKKGTASSKVLATKNNNDIKTSEHIDENDSKDVAISNPCGSVQFINFNGKNALQFKLNETGVEDVSDIIPNTELDT
jgi:hypothetical protein